MTCFLIYLLVGERIKKPVPLQEQTVKDAKGRYQRFHGAFTGGFSAGYFNTVGTKEGEIRDTSLSARRSCLMTVMSAKHQ